MPAAHDDIYEDIDDEGYGSRPRRSTRGVWIAFAIIAGIALTVLGFVVDSYVSSPQVERWQDVSLLGRRAIEAKVPPQEGETFLWFYSDAIYGYEADGNLITDQRVVAWFQEEGDDSPAVPFWSTYDEITAISVEAAEGFYGQTVVTIQHADPDNDWELWLGAGTKHTRAVSAINDGIERARAQGAGEPSAEDF